MPLELDGEIYFRAYEASYELGRSTEWVRIHSGNGQPLGRAKYGRENIYLVKEVKKLKEELLKKEVPTQEPDLLSIPEVARRLGFHRTYIWQMVDANEISYVDLTPDGKKKRSGIRIRATEVERLLQEKEHKRKSSGESLGA